MRKIDDRPCITSDDYRSNFICFGIWKPEGEVTNPMGWVCSAIACWLVSVLVSIGHVTLWLIMHRSYRSFAFIHMYPGSLILYTCDRRVCFMIYYRSWHLRGHGALRIRHIASRTYEDIGRHIYGDIGHRTYGDIGCRTYRTYGAKSKRRIGLLCYRLQPWP